MEKNYASKKFKELYVELWSPEIRDTILPNFTAVLSDEEWYNYKEIPEVGSYNPKISLLSVARPTEAQLAVKRCQKLAEQYWESILQQSIFAEDFYVKLSGSVREHMEPKSFDEEY